MLNASVDLLKHLGHKEYAQVIWEATYETIVTKGIRTPGKLFLTIINVIERKNVLLVIFT